MSSSPKHLVPAVLFSGLLFGPGISPGVCSEQEAPTMTRVTGMRTTHYMSASTGKLVELPPEISSVLGKVLREHLHMPRGAEKIILSMKYAEEPQWDIYGNSYRPDVWVRRFTGVEGGKNGLAVSIRLGCNDLQNKQFELRLAGVQDLPADILPSCDWLTTFPTGRLETGLLLFLASSDGALEPVHEVRGTFFPQITPAMMAQLQQRGAGEPFITVSGFDNRENMEVMIEHDPERALPYDTPGYGIPYENAVYGGMLVWTGSSFEIRQTD